MKKYFKGNDVVINPGGGGSTGSTSNKTEDLQFYYHPDHLGSSNYITDVSGEVYQHQEYFPFGETFIEERNDAEYTTYLFNGKELDEETGLYYYGARYYDPKSSLWQSVDPLVEKHPNISAFAYCANNPIVLVDPDGQDIVVAGKDKSSITLRTDLIDIKVDASSLGVNFGGNYSLQGDDVLSATLDIVGIVDPTGVADGLNATLSGKNGDWFSAGISVLGIIPYIGDVAKVGKIGKDVKIIEKAIDAVKASKLKTIEKGSKDWKNAAETMAKGGKSNLKTKTATEAKELLKEGRGNMNRYKEYSKDKGTTYKKGYETHNKKNTREIEVGNDLPHIKWKDSKAGGHIYYEKPN